MRLRSRKSLRQRDREQAEQRKRYQIRGHGCLFAVRMKMCGMIARAIISGANPISKGGRVRTWTLATPRADAFARAG
jgi:hypothetical protein